MRVAAIALQLAALLGLAACNAGPLADLAPPTVPPARIAYVGLEGDVFVVAPDGSSRRRLTNLGIAEGPRRSLHFFPSWSPDGRHLAVVRADLEDDVVAASGFFTIPVAGGAATRVRTPDGASPVFTSWSPDARALALLTKEHDRIVLRLASPDGAVGARAAEGVSLYVAWSPDSRRIAAHMGGPANISGEARLAVVHVDGVAARAEQIRVPPSAFRAPAYAPDGRTVFVAMVSPEGRGEVRAWSADGPGRHVIAGDYDQSFVLAPDGSRIAVTNESETPGLRVGIEVVDLASDARWQVTDGPVLAFFWSPDGERLAWVEVDDRAGALVWMVGDGRGAGQAVAHFLPSSAYLQTLGYFDQYASSTQVWSPDSRSLLFAGWSEPGPGDVPHIWVVDAQPGARPRSLGEGVFASYSPYRPIPR